MWAFGVLAMAGPRWDFKEVTAFKSNKNLVIALDLSKAMDASDLKPSRLVRARQKIQDILDDSPGVSIGLIAFAADAHLITPITEDKGAIHYLLGALRTDLVYVPGSRLSPALNLADRLLSAVPGQEKSVLVMSDGDFEDGSASTPSGSWSPTGSRSVRWDSGRPKAHRFRAPGAALLKSQGKWCYPSSTWTIFGR